LNYLAHAYLSPDDDLVLMGNVWGDLLKPRDFPDLPDAMMRGVLLHRHIDQFTDNHLHVAAIRDLLRPDQGKYTPVVADVLMDFILSRHWDRYHPQPLADYCAKRYAIVEEHFDLVPVAYQPRVRRMLDNRWLESCDSRERMGHTLSMLGRRATFDNVIARALEPYDRHAGEIDRRFLAFFDDLRAEVILRSGG
jgi:acyl carrier protein phosphodiesterase